MATVSRRVYYTELLECDTDNGGEGFGIRANTFSYVKLGGSFISTPYVDGDFSILRV
jgi:hypothetical protein